MDSAGGQSWTTPYSSDDENFEIWCRDELFTPSMIRATSLLECACDLHLSELYRSLGLASHLETAKTSSQLTSELGYVESADIALEAMLLRLANRIGLVRVDFGCKSPRFIAAHAAADQSARLESVRRDLAALGDGYAAAMEFLDFGAQNFVRSLRDDPDFMDRVLSGRERAFLPIWHRATNQDPLQDAHGRMGARLIDQIFDRGNVLEVGGGTGNGIRHLLRRFADKQCLSRLESYVFTDVSLPFILGTKQEISKAYPTVKTQWHCLDINKPFRQQRLSPESFALIYGVNAAHIARDTVTFLQECRSTLRPGGQAVFAERIRFNPQEMAPRELTLNLSAYHRTAAIRNPVYRPMHAYLSPEHWLRALKLAGFRKSRVLPRVDALSDPSPSQYAAVVVGEK